MWSGNSAATAMKNYALVRKEDYDDSGEDKSYAKSDAISDGNGRQAAANENEDTKKTVFPNNGLMENTAGWAIQDSNL